MSPIPPDPDMRVADSDTAAQAQRTSRALEAQATEVRKQADALAAANAGRGIDRGFEKLVQLQQKLDRMADQARLDQAFAEALGHAAQQFRSTAPTVAEVQAALDEWERLSAQLTTASGVGTGIDRAALQKQVDAAGDNYEMLLEQRKAAITAHDEAVERAIARRRAAVPPRNEHAPNTPGGAAVAGTGLSAGQTPEQARAMEDLLSRQSGPPAQLPPQAPSIAGTLAGRLTGEKSGDKPSAKSPLDVLAVASDPSIIDDQIARVREAQQRLDAAQKRVDAAAVGAYTGSHDTGDIRGITQELFDARKAFTEERDVLDGLGRARESLGGPPVSLPPLPDRVDKQSFPPEPPVLQRSVEAFAEGSQKMAKDVWNATMPDVPNMYRVATDWDGASTEEKTQAGLDAAGFVPLPGAKALSKGLEHVGDMFSFGARHGDDVAHNVPTGAIDHTPHGSPAAVDHPTAHPTPGIGDHPAPIGSPTTYSPQAPEVASNLNDAYLGGHPTTDLARDVADLSTHRIDGADRVVLGKWAGQDAGYIGEARAHGGIYYDTGPDTWNAIKHGLDPAQAERVAWQVNEQFLHTQLGNHVPRIEYLLPKGFDTVEQVAAVDRRSFSAREINFLKEHAARFGYRQHGNSWVYEGGN